MIGCLRRLLGSTTGGIEKQKTGVPTKLKYPSVLSLSLFLSQTPAEAQVSLSRSLTLSHPVFLTLSLTLSPFGCASSLLKTKLFSFLLKCTSLSLELYQTFLFVCSFSLSPFLNLVSNRSLTLLVSLPYDAHAQTQAHFLSLSFTSFDGKAVHGKSRNNGEK